MYNYNFIAGKSTAVLKQIIATVVFAALGAAHIDSVMAQANGDKTQSFWIRKLGLIPHIEGGYFKYEFGSGTLRKTAHGAERKDYSGIYFMVTHDSPSRFHEMKSDEIWYYHAGAPLTMHVIDENGEYHTTRIGPDPDRGEVLSVVMRAGWIFGSSVDAGDYGLVSCLVVPGYDDADYRLVTQAELLKTYPAHRDIIMKMAYRVLPR
ncbi:cupin domain-containing protein [Burkholderia alba]|uniref:cupin domain-containing protein n=1 Tax=Burkholderia alba TaxID=2683677 RepID=UPI002B062650|nr:cupin domain-containing protein [Burkholderia alba]